MSINSACWILYSYGEKMKVLVSDGESRFSKFISLQFKGNDRQSGNWSATEAHEQ